MPTLLGNNGGGGGGGGGIVGGSNNIGHSIGHSGVSGAGMSSHNSNHIINNTHGVLVHNNQMMMNADEVNSLDDVVAQCSSEILKRVESARRNKDDKCPLKGVQRIAKKGLLGGSGSQGGIIGGDETLSRGGALSEKSSDSGVSSSSLSSGPIKNNS